MAVLVSFIRTADAAPFIGDSVAFENLTLSTGVTTTRAFGDGEVALVVSTEGNTIKAATGSTPDAATTAKAAASNAAVPVPPLVQVVITGDVGEKINFKPL